ncbi:MAG: hypothetical protein ACT4QC_10385 [Planctomycetaceae bacterium]
MPAAEYTIRRKVLTFLGAKFHIYNPQGQVIGFSHQKAFKLKEDIRVFTDESMQDERLSIKARQIVDFSAAYDVVDSRKQEKLGALKRKGWSSLLRDSWIVMDDQDREVGQIIEDSWFLALMRRFVGGLLIPQHFSLKDSSGQELAELRTHFNPFVHRMTVSVHEDCPLNPLLVLAAGILLVAIEGREK